MPGIDERLERDLERAARPAAPNPGATLDDVTRRRARRTTARKTQTLALVVVVLVGTAAGFLALQRNFTGAEKPATGSTPTPSPSTTAPAFAPIAIPDDPTKVFSVEGLAFSVCRGSMIEGNFLGTGPTYAYVFTKASDAGCLPGEGISVVAVQVPNDAAGTSATLVSGGPLDCQVDPPTCFVWGNPDIDGDGQDEIAIVTHTGASTTSFELYQVRERSDPAGELRAWGVLPLVDGSDLPASFPVGGSVTELSGAFCDEDPSGGRHLVSWTATSSDGSTYDVTETPHGLDGGTFSDLQPQRLTASADSLPPTDLSGCGGSIQNPAP
jgi:hypothetical protein